MLLTYAISLMLDTPHFPWGLYAGSTFIGIVSWIFICMMNASRGLTATGWVYLAIVFTFVDAIAVIAVTMVVLVVFDKHNTGRGEARPFWIWRY